MEKDGQITMDSLKSKTGLNKDQSNFNDAVKTFKDNSHVPDLFESGGKHGNGRFGVQTLAELSKAGPDDKAWNQGDLSKRKRIVRNTVIRRKSLWILKIQTG
jgi:hypothetical protein